MLSLAYSSPNEQNVDFNVTGPDGYREDFEAGYIGLETGGDVRVISGLAPGVYSVAATDDNLQLIETKVEVREGELAPLTFNMQLIEDFEYNLADYEPYGVYEVGAYEPIDVATYGNLMVSVEMADGNDVVVPNINVTGPDDFRRELEGDGVHAPDGGRCALEPPRLRSRQVQTRPEQPPENRAGFETRFREASADFAEASRVSSRRRKLLPRNHAGLSAEARREALCRVRRKRHFIRGDNEPLSLHHRS